MFARKHASSYINFNFILPCFRSQLPVKISEIISHINDLEILDCDDIHWSEFHKFLTCQFSILEEILKGFVKKGNFFNISLKF